MVLQSSWFGVCIEPQSPGDGHIYCILLIRIVFCHVSTNLSLHCLFCVTTNFDVCFYFNIALDVVIILLIFVDIYHIDHTFSHAHIEAHTHKHTYMISTQEEFATTRHRSLVGRGGRKGFVRDKGLTQ